MRHSNSTSFHIIGNGGHSQSVAEALVTQHPDAGIKFFSHKDFDTEDKCRNHVDRLKDNRKRIALVLGIGRTEFRNELLPILTQIFPREFFWPIIHLKAYVSPRASIGWGAVVLANSYIGPNVEISDFCLINTGAIVEHDSKVGFNVSVGPSAVLAGKTIIGRNSFLGMNSSIIQNIELGDSCTVGANTFVNKSFPSGSIIVGNPAREIS